MTHVPCGRPQAIARIAGGTHAPGLMGTVSFYCARGGTWVIADLCGLPQAEDPCGSRVFGFHIHEGCSCSGTDFSDTGGHLDFFGCQHPHHTGDLPPLFECQGRAYLAVLTGRFTVSEVIGRTVVVHADADDFHTQPSGHSGTKIACGVICPC